MRHREGERPIAGYKLISFLGEGGYGEVWKAAAPGGLPCALKFIKLDNNAGLKELKSIGLVKKLRHPNLVPLNAVWLRDEDGNTISEGGDGESLSFRVYGDKELVICMGLGSASLADKLAGARAERAADALPGGLGLKKLLGYMQDAARGIDCLNDPAAHDNPGILPLAHCDIKPANLLLVGGGVQVCDYGVAKAVGKDIKKTMAAGTAAYAPPELINNDPGLKSDQYSLAISYYELRTGHLPLDETKAMMAHIMGQLDFSRVPAEEREVLQQACAFRPADRFPTCEEFVEALHVAGGRTISTSGVHPLKRPSGGEPADTSGDIELEVAPRPPRPTSDVLRPHGDPVAGYTLTKMLGQGGYGQVWQATDEDGVDCALKVLRDVQGKGRHEYETLVRLRKLDHPNLLRIEKLWVLDEFWAPIPAEQLGRDGRNARRLVIRTPLADKNLFQRLTESRRHSQPGIPANELLRYLRQAADALDYLNIDQQTQHRDVKPENLLLKGETLWVSDFGLAKVVPAGGITAQSTSSGMTQEYASPEVLTNKRVTERSDQYSLAVTYHVLRTGRLPFPPGLSMLNLIHARAHGSLDLAEVTEAERPVLRRALAANPTDRFTTCRELMKELAEALTLSSQQMPVLGADPAPIIRDQRGNPAVHTTLEFPTTETRVKFEADPLEPEPTSEWKAAASPRSVTKVKSPVAKFKEEERGGGKLLLGGLATAAVVGLGLAGYFVFTANTPPTTPSVASGTEPTKLSGNGVGTADTKSTPVTPTDDRFAKAREAVKSGAADALAQIDALPDGSADQAAWKKAWRLVLKARAAATPAAVSADELIRFADDLQAPKLPADADDVTAARRELITGRAVVAVPKFDSAADFAKARPALEAADPGNDWVRAALTEAKLEVGEKPAFAADSPPGVAPYLKAVLSGDASQLADAVPADKPDWLKPWRAVRLADGLATAVEAARVNKQPGAFGDQSGLVAGWLLALGRAADAAGPAGPGARKTVAADVVLLSATRPELKELAGAVAGQVSDETIKSLPPAEQAKLWAAVADRAGPGKATVTALRKLLATDATARPVFANLKEVSALIGPGPDADTKLAAADLLADAGRLLFRHRDDWKNQPGFGTSADNLRRAGELFGQAATLAERPDDFAWQGLVRVATDRNIAIASLAELSNRGGDGLAATTLRGIVAARKVDHAAALKSLREAITRGRHDVPRSNGELVMAYRQAGPSAIAYAHTAGGAPTRGRLIGEAIEWGEALDKLEPARADGAVIAGCASEDRGWLDRMPLDVKERCGPNGPYAKADGWFRKAATLAYDVPAAAASNRGRNLFKWAEDECQLGKYTAEDTTKLPPRKKSLEDAATALGPVGETTGPLAAEARYWLAEVALLRVQAAERAGDGDRRTAQKEAIAALKPVLPRPGETADPAKWQIGAERLVGIHVAESDRLEKTGELSAAAAAAARAAEAAAAQALPKARQAELLVRQAGLSMAQGGDDPAKQATHYPAARSPLTRAIKGDPDNPARWEWRLAIGKVELAAARELKDTDKKRATARYAAACNHLRVAQVVGYKQKQDTPVIAAAFNLMQKQIGPIYGDIDRFLKAEYPDGLPVDRFGAAVRLVWIDLDYEADKKVADEKRPQVTKLLAMLRADKAGLDDDLKDAGEAAADRVLSRK